MADHIGRVKRLGSQPAFAERGPSHLANRVQNVAEESDRGDEARIGRVKAAQGEETVCERFGYIPPRDALDDDGIPVPQEVQLAERRPGARGVDDNPMAGLQLGRHGVVFDLEDAQARGVGVALVEQERFRDASRRALRVRWLQHSIRVGLMRTAVTN